MFSEKKSSISKPQPDLSSPFVAELTPKAGASVGKIQITFTPTQAFVIGDVITADIRVQPNLLQGNETASVMVRFPDCWTMEEQWAWTNSWDYNAYLNVNTNKTTPYSTKVYMVFTHEGAYGVNVTVLSDLAFSENAVNFSFPDIVHIKSLDYLQEKQNAQFTNALGYLILGLTNITIIPIITHITNLMNKTFFNKPTSTNDRQETEPE
ncbi:MAG: hypothetical protein ABSA11_05995 [Candidatus Bathyarchaeia archaeon]